MKRIVILIGLLAIVNHVFAQSKTTDSTKLIIRDAVYISTAPLYIVNGDVSDIKKVNPDSIYSIDVFKGDRATALYGSRGVNGVVFITTKSYQAKETAKKVTKPDTLPHLKPRNDTLFLVDGVPVKTIKNIKPDSVFSIDVLTDKLEPAMFDRKNSVVIAVTTKQGAIWQYQKKLAKFCKQYQRYLEIHNGNDANVSYLLDGLSVGALVDKTTRLYTLKGSDIVSVSLTMVPTSCYTGDAPLVKISTKNSIDR